MESAGFKGQLEIAHHRLCVERMAQDGESEAGIADQLLGRAVDEAVVLHQRGGGGIDEAGIDQMRHPGLLRRRHGALMLGEADVIGGHGGDDQRLADAGKGGSEGFGRIIIKAPHLDALRGKLARGVGIHIARADNEAARHDRLEIAHDRATELARRAADKNHGLPSLMVRNVAAGCLSLRPNASSFIIPHGRGGQNRPCSGKTGSKRVHKTNRRGERDARADRAFFHRRGRAGAAAGLLEPARFGEFGRAFGGQRESQF